MQAGHMVEILVSDLERVLMYWVQKVQVVVPAVEPPLRVGRVRIDIMQIGVQ